MRRCQLRPTHAPDSAPNVDQTQVVVSAISPSDAELATNCDLKAEMSKLNAEVFRALWLQGVGIVTLTKLL